MRWVTYYRELMTGIRDVEFHDSKKEALRYFKRSYRNYFELNVKFNPKDAPCVYGFYHRSYNCISLVSFKKAFPDFKIPKPEKKDKEAEMLQKLKRARTCEGCRAMYRGSCGDRDTCELGYELKYRRILDGVSMGFPGEPCPKPKTNMELCDAPKKWELPSKERKDAGNAGK